MSFTTSPLGDVQTRIAEIQSRFASVSPPAVGSPTGETFAGVLAGVQGGGPAAPPMGDAVPFGIPTSTAGSTTLGGVLGVSPTAPVAPGASTTGERAVALAEQHLGVPYVWGGETPVGFDCSGLVQYVYDKLGVALPRVSRDQARAGVAVASLAEARPGDLVAFGSPVDHIGIYAGDNKMVVAPRTGDVVKVQEITRAVSAIRRVVA